MSSVLNVRNEHGQPMGEIEKIVLPNGNIGFRSGSTHMGGHLDTLTEGAGRFWLWLLDERFRSVAQRSR